MQMWPAALPLLILALLSLVTAGRTEPEAVRTAHRAPSSFEASVSEMGGGITVTTAGGSVRIGSRFSRPGPTWSTLAGDAAAVGGGWAALTVVSAGAGRWNVTAENPAMSLRRTVTVLGTHVAVSDTLTARPGAAAEATAASLPVAIQVEHTARFATNATVTGAELPGSLYPFSCSTIENQDEYLLRGEYVHNSTLISP